MVRAHGCCSRGSWEFLRGNSVLFLHVTLKLLNEPFSIDENSGWKRALEDKDKGKWVICRYFFTFIPMCFYCFCTHCLTINLNIILIFWKWPIYYSELGGLGKKWGIVFLVGLSPLKPFMSLHIHRLLLCCLRSLSIVFEKVHFIVVLLLQTAHCYIHAAALVAEYLKRQGKTQKMRQSTDSSISD